MSIFNKTIFYNFNLITYCWDKGCNCFIYISKWKKTQLYQNMLKKSHMLVIFSVSQVSPKKYFNIHFNMYFHNTYIILNYYKLLVSGFILQSHKSGGKMQRPSVFSKLKRKMLKFLPRKNFLYFHVHKHFLHLRI